MVEELSSSGGNNPRTELTRDDVRTILTSDLERKELAEMFDVSRTAIGNIQRRDAWDYINEELPECGFCLETIPEYRKYASVDIGMFTRDLSASESVDIADEPQHELLMCQKCRDELLELSD